MTDQASIPIKTHDVIVVGSGLAGLISALALGPRSVTLITKTPQLRGGSSSWAKGGIAAAIGPCDTPEYHAADTISAGAGMSDPELALDMATEGVEALKWLVKIGVPFDRTLKGDLVLAREAAHSHPRIVHAGGDATGLVLMNALIERVRQTPSINVLENTFACELMVNAGKAQGLLSFSPSEGWVHHQSSSIVLATGGIGMIWRHTTNPRESTGDGLAMAAHAGALLTDLEFMQFHPTALVAERKKGGISLPLLTEALRGAGALLVDEAGHRFMTSEHPDSELAPRDVVARAIQRRMTAGGQIYLDLRPVLTNGGERRFPQAIAASQRAGLDPTKNPLPITPAAHYHMGGIQIDDRGRTSLSGLWACGEVATTGIHGANRLASNSLLEALVYARRVANDICKAPIRDCDRPLLVPETPTIPPSNARTELRAIVTATRKLMSRYVGVFRSGTGLKAATTQLTELGARLKHLTDIDQSRAVASAEMTLLWGETRNLVLIARLVTLAALQREESRGAHYRDDFPVPRLEWQRRQTLTIDTIVER
jgi:L-aspartate oxidase